MKYFGPPWTLAPDDPDMETIPTPVGAACARCKELFQDGDQGYMMPSLDKELPFHINCYIRMVVGSVAHIERRCGCFVEGATEHDAPELTARQAADAAVAAFRKT